ncbi:hypothetical protein [Fluviispira vulneris]|uniref:hypothetical protein n=1 Tax=Fluviispira vulneris TaxID=2763012 RepID=UPI0016442A12|nr:hypothetical protein [Fluviispira vulneris]
MKLMESAIHELSLIRDEKAKNLTNLTSRSQELQLILAELIQTYKSTKDESLKQEYSKLANERDSLQKRIEDIHVNLAEQNELIDNYNEKKEQIQANLTNLKEHEKETLLNINSFKKIQEIEKNLSTISENNYNKTLEKVQEYNAKIKATAKISIQLNQKSNQTLDDELMLSGADNKYNNEFKQNLKMEEMWNINKEKKIDTDKNRVNDLFS